MSQTVNEYRCDDQYRSDYKRRDLALSLGFKGLSSRVVLKSSDPYAGSIDTRSTIGARGFIGTHRSAQINVETFDVVDMNISGVMSSRSRRSPRTHSETFGSDGQSPAGVEINHISPTDGDLLQGIGYHKTLVVKGNFWSDQKGIDAGQYGSSYTRAGSDRGAATLVEARPEEERAHQYSEASKYQVGVGAINVSITHYGILSHHSGKARHSVKAVR
jgi:hypothetical protein